MIRRKIDEEKNGNWSSRFPFLVQFFPEALNVYREKKKKSGRVIVIVKKWQGHKSEMQERGGRVAEGGKKTPNRFFFDFLRAGRGGKIEEIVS